MLASKEHKVEDSEPLSKPKIEEISTKESSRKSKGDHWNPFDIALDPTVFFRSRSMDTVPKVEDEEFDQINKPSKDEIKEEADIDDQLSASLSKLGLNSDAPPFNDPTNTNIKSTSKVASLLTKDEREKDPNSGKNKSVTLFKTEMCTTYMNTGYCRYNNKCRFAHGISDLRSISRHPKYKTQLCKNYYENGSCPYGKRCCYLHQTSLETLATASSGSQTPVPGSYQTNTSVPSFYRSYSLDSSSLSSLLQSSTTSSTIEPFSIYHDSCQVESSPRNTEFDPFQSLSFYHQPYPSPNQYSYTPFP